jgi:hypothetical protein
MVLMAFNIPHTGMPLVDRALLALSRHLEATDKPVLLEKVTLSSSGTLVPHTLGRAYRDWRVTRIYADAGQVAAGSVLEVSTTRAATHLHLRTLGWTNDVVCNLEVV